MKNKYLLALFIFLSGLCASLPLSVEWLSFFALFAFVPYLLILFSHLLGEQKKSLAFWYRQGFLFFFGYLIGVFHWFVAMYPMEFAGDFSPTVAVFVVAFSWFGLSFLQTLVYALTILLTGALARLQVVRRYPLSLPFLFAAAFTVAEFLQTLTWAGTPWGVYAVTQANRALTLAPASLFGAHFVSFLLILFNGLLAYGILRYRQSGNHRTLLRYATGVLAFFVLWCALGGVLVLTREKPERTVKVAILQGNISSRDKWSVGSQSVATFRILAHQAAKEGAEVMLWPETAIPAVLSEDSHFIDDLFDIAEETNAIQVVGAFREEETEEDYLEYNSLFVIYPDRTVKELAYDKRHLVPFGEFVPFAELMETLIPPMAELMTRDPVAVGASDPVVFHEEIGSFGGLICFDSIYEQLARDTVKNGAEVLLLATNDSWFLDSEALRQHHAQAQLRAVETGRYIARCGVTGISSVIDHSGQIVKTLPSDTCDYLVADLPLCTDTTLFVRVGNLWVALCALFLASPAIYSIVHFLVKKRRNHHAS